MHSGGWPGTPSAPEAGARRGGGVLGAARACQPVPGSESLWDAPCWKGCSPALPPGPATDVPVSAGCPGPWPFWQRGCFPPGAEGCGARPRPWRVAWHASLRRATGRK